MSELPDHLQSRLDRELDEGEEAVWSACPDERLLRRDARKVWYVVGVFAGVVIALMLAIGLIQATIPEADRSDEPGGFFIAAGVVLVAWLISYLIVPWYARSVASNTIYAITPKRAIILNVHSDGSITERDYRPEELIYLARHERPDGAGTLIFESARGAGRAAPSATGHKFQAIHRVIEIERMLRRLFGDA